jgi:hypothetical protein
MSKEITSKIIGQLIQEEQFEDWWKSTKIEIPFFEKKKLAVTFMDCIPELDSTFIEEADNALTNFMKLNLDDRNLISELAFNNCMQYLDAVGYDEADEHYKQIKSHNKIWNFIQPTEIYVTRRPYNEQDIYVMVACECDWEKEHGLQLVFRQGKKLTRISNQDGHLTDADANDIPDEEDELLSNF